VDRKSTGEQAGTCKNGDVKMKKRKARGCEAWLLSLLVCESS